MGLRRIANGILILISLASLGLTLLGVYRASLGAEWGARLGADPSLQALLKSARVKVCTPADPSALDSLNTPEDLARHGVSR